MAVSGHIRKRQFQPSIDSYFHANAGSNTFLFKPTRQPSQESPLSEEVQASLLSVGMRVRKSIPEGYKTHKTLGKQCENTPSTAPATSRAIPRQSYARTSASTRELTPFCGLHKVGGLAAQEMPHSSAPAVLQGWEDDLDDMPDLTASQDTLGSIEEDFPAFGKSTRKRTYYDDIEDDLDAYFNDDTAMDAGVSRASGGDRPRARLKQRGGRPGQGNMNAGVRVFGADDFADAEFLQVDGMDVDSF